MDNQNRSVARHRKNRTPRRPAKRVLTSAMVLIERFGLDGKPARSLEEVSKRYGLPRFSVRLLEARLVIAMKRADRLPMPMPFSQTAEAVP